MSHHYSGPDLSFPFGDARLDLADLFAFPTPGASGKSIFIMDVHPSVGLNPPGPTTTEPFGPEALYEFKIATNGDAVANIAYQVRFASSAGGGQTATVRRLDGAQAAATGGGGQVVIADAPVSMGQDAHVTTMGGYRFFAGWRSDPFFFDTMGALNNLQFAGGQDFFTAKNICSIVLEIPNTALGSGALQLWARTVARIDGKWVQAERGARPSQTPFLTGDQNTAYRAAEPAGDAAFIPVFAHSLEHTGGFSTAEATRVAKTLLPDVLRYDPGRPARFPDNGRTLTDDVADVFLSLITNGKVKGDGVGPHIDLLPEFPYVGPPHGMA
jgi:hypothetical protein